MGADAAQRDALDVPWLVPVEERRDGIFRTPIDPGRNILRRQTALDAGMLLL
jgi:hypothetical protein